MLKRLQAAVMGSAVLGLLNTTAASAYLDTSNGWNLPTGATDIGAEVFSLHMWMFWICTVIGIGVFGTMMYSIIRHRKSLGAKSASFHHSTAVEIVWTALPFAILIAIAIPAAGTLIKMEDTRDADITIKVTGYQWMWEYEYLGEHVRFFSRLKQDANEARQLKSGIDVHQVENYLVDVDRPLMIPVGKKVRFLITSNDVIHAWWVSDLTVKKDAIPGYINEAWTNAKVPGTYRGVCAELCGRDHGFMPIVVEAVPQDEFDAWLAEQKGSSSDTADVAGTPKTVTVDESAATEVAAAGSPAVAADDAAEGAEEAADAEAPAETDLDALMASGETVYTRNCAACHQAAGTGLPPNFPSLVGSAVVTGDAEAQVMQILKGKGMMPPFANLSDADIAAVVTYTRNSWGNDSGVVQPADVAALR